MTLCKIHFDSEKNEAKIRHTGLGYYKLIKPLSNHACTMLKFKLISILNYIIHLLFLKYHDR